MIPDRHSGGRVGRSSSPRDVPWITLGVVGLLAAVYAVQLSLATRGGDLAAYSTVTANPVAGRLLAPLLHGHDWHLAGNLLVLLPFGAAFEYRFGRRQYLAFLLGTAYLGTTVQTALKALAGQPGVPIGISGATFALAAFVGVHSLLTLPGPRTIVTDLGALVRFEAALAGVAMIAVAALAHAGAIPVSPTTATAAHVAGAAAGSVLGAAAVAGVVPIRPIR